MPDLLRSNDDTHVIQLTDNFKRDLKWFSTFLSKYNGASFYDHVKTQHVVELDACLTGLGGGRENLVYHLPLPHHYRKLGIAQLVIHIFASFWHKSILIRFDNAAVVSVITTGKARNPFWQLRLLPFGWNQPGRISRLCVSIYQENENLFIIFTLYKKV